MPAKLRPGSYAFSHKGETVLPGQVVPEDHPNRLAAPHRFILVPGGAAGEIREVEEDAPPAPMDLEFTGDEQATDAII